MQQTIVYKEGGPHQAQKGKTFSYRGVDTEEELKKLLSSGWFESLPEALSGKKKQLPKEEPKKEVSEAEVKEEPKEAPKKRGRPRMKKDELD